MKKIVALVLCLVMVLGLMTGCQKAMDAKTLYQKMGEAMKAVTAQAMDAEMDLEMKMSSMGVTMSMGLDMDMKVQAKADLSAMYYDMNMAMNALGQAEEMKMEMYAAMEDGALVLYIYESTEDMWVKTVQNDYAEMMNGLLGMEKEFTDVSAANLTLAKDQETINGRKCYVLTEQIDGAAMQEQMGDTMTQMLPQMAGTEELDEESMAQLEAVMEGMDWSKLSGTCVYHVDAETFLPLDMSVEVLGMGDVLNGMISALMAQMAVELDEETPAFSIEIPTFKIVTKNMTYNDDVQVPAVPQEAIDNAIDADAMADDEYLDDEYTDFEDELLTNEPQADGSYLLTMGADTIRVMVPEGYVVYMADAEMIVAMTEDMLSSVNYMLMTEMTAADMEASVLEEVTWAQEEDYYKSHSEVAELNGFQTMSLIYNDDTSIWYAWKELDGGCLLMGAEVEGETFDLASLIATVQIGE